MGWPFHNQQAQYPNRGRFSIEEVPEGKEYRQTGGVNRQQPSVEEPDDDGNFPQSAHVRPPHPRTHRRQGQQPPRPDPFFGFPGFSEDPWFASRASSGSHLSFGDDSPIADHPFAGRSPFADFGIRGPDSMMANMRANMDRMRMDMRNTMAEPRAHSAPAEGNSFTYTCTKWTSVDGGQGGPKIEHRVAAYGSSDLGHHLKETVKNGRTGETKVLREESRPVGYRHRDHQPRQQQALTNK